MDFNLVDILYVENIDIRAVAGHWLRNYQNNEKSATTDLIILLYCAAGAKPFTRESVKDLCPEELFILKSNEHENCEKGISETAYKNFVNFIEFILCRNSKEFFSNKIFMKIIQTTLQSFAEDDRTRYRNVSVVVGIRLMSSALFIDGFKKEELNSAKHSLKEFGRENYDAFDKLISDGNGAIYKEIAERKNETFLRVKKLQKNNFRFKIIFLNLLSSVFEEALRSHEVEIRLHCHDVIGTWIASFIILDYVGKHLFPLLCKMMNDPDDELREMAVKNYLHCLQSNIESTLKAKDLVNILRVLLERVHDCKDEIKIYALKCLNIIDRRKMFSPNKVEKILLLIFHNQREVSSKAGYFLHRRIVSAVAQTNDDDFQITSRKYIGEIVSFSQECPDNCPEEFLIDALINKSKFLTDWSAWIKLLLEEDVSQHDEIDVEHIMSLMSCTLKLANTGMVPVGRNAKKGNPTLSLITKNIKESSRPFKENIENLWSEFEKKDRIFHKLLKCFRYLSFGDVDAIFIFEVALKFQNVLNGSRDLSLCNECAIGFAMFCENSIRNVKCESAEWETIEGLIEDFSESLVQLCNSTIKKISKDTIEKHLEQSIEIAALHSLQDIAESMCWNILFVDACEMIQSKRKRDNKIVRLYLIVCFMSIMWISIFLTAKNFQNGIVEIEIVYEQKLKEACEQFFPILHTISREPNALLKNTARKIILWLKKLSCFIQKNGGLQFLKYRNDY